MRYFQKSVMLACVCLCLSSSVFAQSPEDFFNRAYVYVQRGYIDDAIAEYNAALQYNPEKEMATRIYYNLGLIYNRIHEPERAVESYEKALQIRPNLFIVRFGLANTLYDLKHYKRAAEEYIKALKIDPEYSNKFGIYFRIASAYNEIGNYDASIEWCQKIVDTNQSEAAVWELLAENYFAKKYYKEVEQCLNKLESLGYPQKEFFKKLQEARKTEQN